MAAKKAKEADKEMEAQRLLWDAEWFVSSKAKEHGLGRYFKVEIKGNKGLAQSEFNKNKAPFEFSVQEVMAFRKEIDKPKMKKLGEFQVASGEVVVSDPCYSDDTWCMGFLKGVANGTWEAEIRTGKEGRVAKLYATLKGAKRGKTWEEANFQVGVDSGQAGIWDKPCYRTPQEGNKALVTSHWESMVKDEDQKGTGGFYAAACSLTCGDDNGATSKGGVMVGGCVSSSGYGDGGYTCYFQRGPLGIYAICIQFM